MRGELGAVLLIAACVWAVPVSQGEDDGRLDQIEADLSIITRYLRNVVEPEPKAALQETSSSVDQSEIPQAVGAVPSKAAKQKAHAKPLVLARTETAEKKKIVPMVQHSNEPYSNIASTPLDQTFSSFAPAAGEKAPLWDIEREHKHARIRNTEQFSMPESEDFASGGLHRITSGKDAVSCPGHPECSGRGMCDGGVCRCDPLFYSADCSLAQCVPRCSEHGKCDNGTCVCQPGWAGALCEEITCYPACEHGECIEGECQCEPGFQGDACHQHMCPGTPECGGDDRGACQFETGVCTCHDGWGGEDCTLPEYKCAYECINGGRCNNGTCDCPVGWEGLDCGIVSPMPYLCTGGAVWNKHASGTFVTCSNMDDPSSTGPPAKAVARCACPPELPIWHEESRQCVDREFCYVSACGDMPAPASHEVVIQIKPKTRCDWTDPAHTTGGSCGGQCVAAAEEVTICYKAGYYAAEKLMTSASAGIVLFREGAPCAGEPNLRLEDLAKLSRTTHTNSSKVNPDMSTTYTTTTTTVHNIADFSGLPNAVLSGAERRSAGSVSIKVKCLGSYSARMIVVDAGQPQTLATYGTCKFSAENASCPGTPPCNDNGFCKPGYSTSTCSCTSGYLPPACDPRPSQNATRLPLGVTTVLPIPPDASVSTEGNHVIVQDHHTNTTYNFSPNGTVEINHPNNSEPVIITSSDPHMCSGGTEWQACSSGCLPTCRNPNPRCLPTCLHGACQCPPAIPLWDDITQTCVAAEACSEQVACPGIGAVCSGHGDCINSTCQCAEMFSGADCSVYSEKEQRVTTVSGTVQAVVPCHFPFTFRGKEYTDCTTDYDSDGKEWCSVTYEWEHQWAFCGPRGSCPEVNGIACNGRGTCLHGKCTCQPNFSGEDCSFEYVRYANTTHQPCAFPFLGSDMVNHYDCIPGIPVVENGDVVGTTPAEGVWWCLTSFRYDGPQSIGFCAPSGTCGQCDTEGGMCDGFGSGRCHCNPGYQGVTCSKKMTEREILIDLFSSTKGPEWIRNTGWGSDGSPCDAPGWTGVSCRDGHVVRLNLDSTGLTGTIPPSLSALNHLEVLDLSNNALVGSFPRSLLYRPTTLRYISVSSNYLVGETPVLPARVVYADFRQNYMKEPSDDGEATLQTRVTDGVGPAEVYSECSFPFEFRGKLYNHCTTDWSDSEQAWCSVTREFDGKWGRCAPAGTCPGANGQQCSGHGKCVKSGTGSSLIGTCECDEGYKGSMCNQEVTRVTRATTTGTIEEQHRRPCQFPFEYGGKVYRDCTTDDSPTGEEWCLTTSHWERKWGFCDEQDACPGGSAVCSGHGDCNDGVCECDEGYIWNDCSQKMPRATTGSRFGGKSQGCQFPFSVRGVEYKDCVALPFISNTSFCAVQPGRLEDHHKWDTCAPAGTCPGNTPCSENGECYDGECNCNAGFTGLDCSLAMSERDILTKFFRSTNGPKWLDNTNWEITPHCDWEGVSCNEQNQTTTISLSQNNLDGTIPADLAYLAKLSSLDLSSNLLAGTVPLALWTSPALKSINIVNNQLVGPLPESAASVQCDGNCIESAQCAKGSCQYLF